MMKEEKDLGITEADVNADNAPTQMEQTPRSNIKYKTRGDKIFEGEVERETDSSVWIKGRQRSKRTTYDCFFDSFEEAKAYLVSGARKEVEQCKSSLHYARTRLGMVESLKEPSVHSAWDNF